MLKSAITNTDNLIVASYMNHGGVVSALRDAERIDQTIEERAAAKQRVRDDLQCLVAHIGGALDAIPDE